MTTFYDQFQDTMKMCTTLKIYIYTIEVPKKSGKFSSYEFGAFLDQTRVVLMSVDACVVAHVDCFSETLIFAKIGLVQWTKLEDDF